MPSWKNATSSGATSRAGGLLQPDLSLRFFTRDRPATDPGLAPWIENYWSVRWDLPAGTAYETGVLTHPAVNVTVESGAGPRHGFAMPAGLVHGVVTRRWALRLEGEGRVFGAKFRPGGFRAFTGADTAALTDRVVALSEVFGAAAAAYERGILAADDDVDRVAVADAFLLAHRPPPDARYDELLSIVAGMVADPTLTTVDAVAERFAVTPRTLQRLFRRYVGVNPKWVLQRLRLHDAAQLIDTGQAPDLATLAANLGWYDQAHFSRDFADVVGMPPGAYAAARRAATGETRR